MPEVTVDGITLHYERTGSGPPLLLLHGLGSSGEDWEHQVAFLSDRYDVIVPDFRGHGHSSKPSGPYSIEQFGSDIVTLIEELNTDPLVLVGISLGGMVAFQIAAERPDLVDRLIVVNALPAFETKRVSQKIQVAVRKVITRRLTMEKIGEVLSKRLLPDDEMANRRATMVERWARNDKAAYEATFAAILAWPGVADAMARTAVPITVISSELDYIGPEDKQPYIDEMPTAEMMVIERAHHGVPMEFPERFNQVLEEVLL
jgi:pimeloyl-ACP methyl ester carboxylesterase